MSTIVLLGAAFIFLINGVYMLGKVKGECVGVSNICVGALIFILGIITAVNANDSGSMVLAGLSISFALFYLILGWSILGNYDMKALGWYCLDAGIFIGLCSIFYYSTDFRFFIFDVSWAVLFLAVFINMVLGKNIAKFVGWLLIVEGFFTLLIPTFLMMIGRW